MRNITVTNLSHTLFDAFALAMLIGMFYSFFATSVSIIGLSVLSLYRFFIAKDLSSQHGYLYACYTLLFLATLVSGVNSTDVGEYLHHLQLKLPFLALPLTAYVWQDRLMQHYQKYILGYVLLALFTTLPLLFNALFHFDSILDGLGRGQAFQTPMDHVKYSISLAIAALLCLHLVLFENPERNKLLQTSVGFGFGFLFLVLHFLAIRAGIVLVYIGGLAICMHYFLRQKKYFLSGLTVLAFLVLPIVAYKTIPSFTKKINYSLYDFKQYQQGEGLNFSDSERMFGYEAALRLIQNQPILGTGIGDLKSEMKSSYKENLDMGLSKYPHNQYLFFLTGLGLLGLSFVLFALFYPIWKVGYREYFLFILLQVLFFISFMVENVLERSFGAVLYLTITLLTLTRALYLAELNASRANSPSNAEV